MSLEAMNKNELVKHARSLEQEMKQLKFEMEALKKEKEEAESTKEVPVLTRSAVCTLKSKERNRSVVAKVFFDFEGNSRVEIVSPYPEPHYKTEFLAAKVLNEVVLQEPQNEEGEE